MKKLMIVAAIAIAPSLVSAADTKVRGHTRSDGTYVAPHHRSAPDSNRANNYSSEGRYNPYTGKAGTVDPYRAPSLDTTPGRSSDFGRPIHPYDPKRR